MILLAIDTATRSCSVGIVQDQRVLAERSRSDGQTHSRHLMTMVEGVLLQSGLALADLDALAVTVGPGSFTGLRIGIATAKGLAASSDLVLVGVSTLEALALQADAEKGLVCPLIDARKGEVYGGFFRPRRDSFPLQAEDPFVCTPEQAAAKIQGPCRFIGDGALLYRGRLEELLGDLALFSQEKDHRIRAGTVGRIGLERLASGRPDDPSSLSPVYVRKSDAELKLGRKTGLH